MTNHQKPAPYRGGVVLLTGVQAAGKSTVAQALAVRLPRSAHIRGDLFRRMVVNGGAPIAEPPTEEMTRDLRMRYRLGAQSADRYAEAGYTAVLQDVILGQDLADTVAAIHIRPLAVVVLDPGPDAVAAREEGRDKDTYGNGITVDLLVKALREQTPRIGLWLDTSELTVEQTVDEILARAWTEGAVP